MINILFSLILSSYAMGGPLPKAKFVSTEYCYLTDQINMETTSEVLSCLKANPGYKLYLNSPGGMVQAGIHIIKYVNQNNVTVACMKCYSMAANIWLNAKNREAFKESHFMMHYIWAFIIGPYKIADLRKLADDMEKATEVFLKNLRQDQRQYFIIKMKKSDFYFRTKTLDLLEIDYKLLEY